MIRLGVIGYGYWGPNLVRNFVELAGTTVSCIADLRPEALQRAGARYPSVELVSDPAELVRRPDVDAVVIATPVSTHYEFALLALQAGKHVLVEKPMAASSAECARLIEEAEARDLVLLVDHTFAYTGAVRRLRGLIDDGELGDLLYYDSVRINLGLFQHDVNVIWDLAVHDLAIMDYLLPHAPVGVSATGVSHVPGQHENIAFVTLFFPDNLIAHLHVNWLAPVKLRQTVIGGSLKMVLYNDLEPAEKIKVYEKGITVEPDASAIRELRVGYRSGDMWAPAIPAIEALKVEAEHFRDCVEGRCEPLTDGPCGLRVVRLLEAATESMRDQGRMVELASSKATAQ